MVRRILTGHLVCGQAGDSVSRATPQTIGLLAGFRIPIAGRYSGIILADKTSGKFVAGYPAGGIGLDDAFLVMGSVVSEQSAHTAVTFHIAPGIRILHESFRVSSQPANTILTCNITGGKRAGYSSLTP